MSAPEQTDARTTLRYSRFGGGYRREDVEAALEQLLGTVRSVEESLQQLKTRSEELESELLKSEAELAAYRERQQRFDDVVRRAEQILEKAEADAPSGDGAGA
jgi:chromosome segregation ATPase